MARVKVAEEADILEGDVFGAEAAGEPIALYRLGGVIFATHDICTHAAALLSDGFVVDDCIECPLHQAVFEIRTGKAVDGPAEEDLKTYPVSVQDGSVFVDLP